jgi:hypothetical protein
MKNFIVSGIFALALLMTGCSDKPVLPAQLPAPIQSFVQQYFPGQTITFAQKDLELTGWKYEIFLADGTHIDFDTDDMWDKIECSLTNPVPTALIPPPVASTIQANYPDAMITKIDKERNGFEVDLANGLELKFNKQGAIVDMDD